MLYFGTKVNSFNFREGNKASNSISKKKKKYLYYLQTDGERTTY